MPRIDRFLALPPARFGRALRLRATACGHLLAVLGIVVVTALHTGRDSSAAHRAVIGIGPQRSMSLTDDALLLRPVRFRSTRGSVARSDFWTLMRFGNRATTLGVPRGISPCRACLRSPFWASPVLADPGGMRVTIPRLTAGGRVHQTQPQSLSRPSYPAALSCVGVVSTHAAFQLTERRSDRSRLQFAKPHAQRSRRAAGGLGEMLAQPPLGRVARLTDVSDRRIPRITQQVDRPHRRARHVCNLREGA